MPSTSSSAPMSWLAGWQEIQAKLAMAPCPDGVGEVRTMEIKRMLPDASHFFRRCSAKEAKQNRPQDDISRRGGDNSGDQRETPVELDLLLEIGDAISRTIEPLFGRWFSWPYRIYKNRIMLKSGSDPCRATIAARSVAGAEHPSGLRSIS